MQTNLKYINLDSKYILRRKKLTKDIRGGKESCGMTHNVRRVPDEEATTDEGGVKAE